MLSRSTSREELVPELNRLLEPQGPWNSLVGLLEPLLEGTRETRGQSYLPYKSHPEFDRLEGLAGNPQFGCSPVRQVPPSGYNRCIPYTSLPTGDIDSMA